MLTLTILANLDIEEFKKTEWSIGFKQANIKEWLKFSRNKLAIIDRNGLESLSTEQQNICRSVQTIIDRLEVYLQELERENYLKLSQSS